MTTVRRSSNGSAVARAGAIRDRLRTRAHLDRPVNPGTAAAVAARRGRATLFAFEPAWALDDWTEGGYPMGFLDRAYVTLGVTDSARVLHLFAGGVRSGVTVDIRHDTRPMVVADVRALPFADATFDWIMADPPYAESYAHTLYGTRSSYVRPSHILAAAARVLRPGGKVGLLHYIVPLLPHKHRLRLERVYGVYTGPAQAIRAWSVWQKVQAELNACESTSESIAASERQ